MFAINTANKRTFTQKKHSCSLLCFCLILFSAFRDGLGTDYYNYLEKMSFFSSFSDVEFDLSSEPFFSLISATINSCSFLQPRFIFLVFAVVTQYGIFHFYVDEDNRFLITSILCYALFPTLYFNTFNLVRQFASTALFLFAISFVRKRQPIKFLITMAAATFTHFSSILLTPLYFVINKKIPLKFLAIFAAIFVLLSSLLPSIFDTIALLDQHYQIYLGVEDELGFSGMVLMISFFFLILVKNYDKIETEFDIVCFNCVFLYLICSILSFSIYFFFRLAVFFTPAVACIIPKAISFICGESKGNVKNYCQYHKWASCVSIVIALALFLVLIISGKNDVSVVPKGFLPVSSIISFE